MTAPASRPADRAPASSAAVPEAASAPACDSANPVLVRFFRGRHVESQHRGAWVLVDPNGSVLDGAGRFDLPVFARSATKSLQALPLIESGAAARFGYGDDEIALAVASHNGEACHTERVARLLTRLGLGEADLRCGAESPGDAETRAELARRGRPAGALHNNCSGKHAGFLALALHLGVEPARYLDPHGAGQLQVRRVVSELSGVPVDALGDGIDGCSAPTFRLPLANLATALARVANPDGLQTVRRAAAERIARAVASHPELIAGTRRRLCSDLARASAGRLLPKVGAEAVYVIGVRGADRALAIKIDDGNARALHPLVLHLCARLGLLTRSEVGVLEPWRDSVLRNHAGLEVGRLEVVA